MKPKKSLGQNFLTSIPARNAIVNAGEVKNGEIVLEIGPGKGMLTSGLLTAGACVIALEKDRELIPLLEEKFSAEIKSKTLTLIEGDALTYTPPKGVYKLIANIPYYITGAILSKYLGADSPPTRMVVLVQKEVASRVVARDGKHSLLSLSVHVYGTPKIVYRVSKGSFNPIPKVDSAVLSISDISHKNFKNKTQEENFFKVIHAGFAHKRKFLIRNLETVLKKEELEKIFEENNIPKNIRSEDLDLNTWLIITSYFK